MPTRYYHHPIEWTPQQVENLWQFYGTNPAFDSAYFSKHSGPAVLRFLRKHVPLSGRHVLDFGSGRGHMLQHLLAAGIACQGLEFSSESAELAEKTIGVHSLFGGIIHAKAIPTLLPDSSLDVVLLIEVLEHLFDDQIQPTLQDIHRILRPGGHIVATTPHAEDLSLNMLHCPECGCTYHRWQHMRSVTVASMSGWMKAAGFEQVICQPTYFEPALSRAANLVYRLQSWYGRLRGQTLLLPHLIYIGCKPEA